MSQKTAIDWQILMPVMVLSGIGLVILLSASMPFADETFHNPYHFFKKQCVSLLIGIFVGYVCFRIRPLWWRYWRQGLIFISACLLVIVLIPGVGHAVKGAYRWLPLGLFQLQVSEVVKLVVMIFMAGFIEQHHDDLRWNLNGFLKPLAVLGIISSLLILEPDFGSVCVILAVSLLQMFVAGSRLRYMILLLLGVVLILAVVAWSAPYRMDRLVAFLNPWQFADNKGYQLIHAMMAVRAGGLFGVGLGESIEKWFYLPEAHNDFLLAILIEECGLIALCAVMMAYGLLVSRMLQISWDAIAKKDWFTSSLVFGIASWWAIQALINIGVNVALLPTKGITLPLISFGGSSLLMFAASLGIVLRVSYEYRRGS